MPNVFDEVEANGWNIFDEVIAEQELEPATADVSGPEPAPIPPTFVSPRPLIPLEDLPPEALSQHPANLGQGLRMMGRTITGGLADLGNLVVRNPFEANTAAALRGEAMPAEEVLKSPVVMPLSVRLAGRGAQGLLETTPRLAAMTGLTMAGVPAWAASATAFGFGEQGFDPKSAAVAAALPFIGKYSGAIAGKIADKFGVSGEVAQEWIKGAGALVGVNAAMATEGELEISKLPQDQRDAARVDMWANIIGMSALGPMGVEAGPGKKVANALDFGTRQVELPPGIIQFGGRTGIPAEAHGAPLAVGEVVPRRPPPVPEWVQPGEPLVEGALQEAQGTRVARPGEKLSQMELLRRQREGVGVTATEQPGPTGRDIGGGRVSFAAEAPTLLRNVPDRTADAIRAEVGGDVSRETVQKGVRVEAQDHPKVAQSNPELLPQLVQDELTLDKKAYDKDQDPARMSLGEKPKGEAPTEETQRQVDWARAVVDRQSGTPDHGIEIVYEPGRTHNGHIVEGWYDRGRTVINAAAFRGNEGRLRQAVNEELGHAVLATDKGKQLLGQFMDEHPLTEWQVQKLQDEGYLPNDGESLGDYSGRLHDEFVAKAGRADMGWLRTMADRLVQRVMTALEIPLTPHQAARAILRELRTRSGAEPVATPSDAIPSPQYEGLRDTNLRFSLRSMSDGIDVDAPEITQAMLENRRIPDALIERYRNDALAKGVSRQSVEYGVEQLKNFNGIRELGTYMVLPERPQTKGVVIREGVLNTPAVEGLRRERLDKALYPAIAEGRRSAATGKLFEGGEERTAIPKEIRGKEPLVFLNVPITQSHLQKPRPADFSYPIVVTGNPHIINFRRPHPSWDGQIKAVRVKPVFHGSEQVTKSVVDAIKYAKEIGAKVLVTTFRSKQPWTLARFTNFLPTDPANPRFSEYWKPNPNPRPADPRKVADYVPYVPRNTKVAEAFRANGWGTEKDIYGEGGTWWWPKSRELDPAVKAQVGDVPLEYCDVLHKGCPACRNCQKLTYPKAAGDPIVGVTDEPFCEHGCPQCFVRLGQSGINGRRGISLGQNAKQGGFGEPDVADIYPETINVLQSAARSGMRGVADYVSRFMSKSADQQMDTLMSLFMSGRISAKDLVMGQQEILNAEVPRKGEFKPLRGPGGERYSLGEGALKAADKLDATRRGIVWRWSNSTPLDALSYTKDRGNTASTIYAQAHGNEVEHELLRGIKGSIKPGTGILRPWHDKDALGKAALTMLREAGDDPAILAQHRNLLANAPVPTTLTPIRQRIWRGWRDKAIAAIDYAVQNQAQLLPASRRYGTATHNELMMEQLAGIDVPLRDNYVMHAQDIEGDYSLGMFSGRGGGEGNVHFRKERKYPTYAESIAAGIIPDSLDSVALLKARLNTGQRAINNRAWLEVMKGMQDDKGRSIAVPLVGGNAPPGYQTASFGGQQIAVLDGFAPYFHALADPSVFARSPGGHALMTAVSTGKHTMLMFDSFHLGRMSFWASVIQRWPVFPGTSGYKRALTLLDNTPAELNRMAARGEIPQAWLNDALRQRDLIHNIAIKTGYNIGGVSDNLYSHLTEQLPIAGAFNKYLFQQFQRGAMFQAWIHEWDRLRSKSPLSDLELGRQISRDLNVRFGSLNNQSWIKSKTFRDLARLFFLAPQWNEGLIRSELGGAKQIITDPFTRRRILAGSLGRSIGALTLYQLVGCQLVNLVTRGHPTWENPEEGFDAKLSCYIPDIIGGGPGFLYSPLALPFETAHLLLKNLERTGEAEDAVRRYLTSRLGSGGRPIYTFLAKRDVFDRVINPKEFWSTFGKSLAPVPISGKSFTLAAQEAAGRAAAAAEGRTYEGSTQEFPGQFQKQAMASVGLKTENAPAADQRIARLAKEFNKEHGVAEQAEFYAGDYTEFGTLLRAGNYAKAKEKLAEILQKKTPDDIRKHFNRAIPFTRSKAREQQFLASLDREGRLAYREAQDIRKQNAAIALKLLGEVQQEMRVNAAQKR